MKKCSLCSALLFFLFATLFFSSSAKALTYTQAEDLADLTAVYLFLNNDCGYEQISKQKIERALIIFHNLSSGMSPEYSMLPMSKLNEDSYQDLKKIYKLLITKMSTTSPKSLSLLNYWCIKSHSIKLIQWLFNLIYLSISYCYCYFTHVFFSAFSFTVKQGNRRNTLNDQHAQYMIRHHKSRIDIHSDRGKCRASTYFPVPKLIPALSREPPVVK